MLKIACGHRWDAMLNTDTEAEVIVMLKTASRHRCNAMLKTLCMGMFGVAMLKQYISTGRMQC